MTSSTLADKDYALVTRTFLQLTGIDLSAYKDQQMRRRLASYIALKRITVPEFCELMSKQPEALQQVRAFITINVSEFFRDAAQFKLLRDRVLSQLLAAKTYLNIWSAGCSMGAEPYSIAMLLDELAMVMSQNAIDSLMAANGGAAEGDEEDAEVEADNLLGALTDGERALVEAVAAEDASPEPEVEVGVGVVQAPPDDTDKPKLRTWSASATTETDQIRERLQDVEDKVSIIEASTMGAPQADPVVLAEIRQTLEQLTTTVQGLGAAVHQLTEHSQGSLGFAAKQTFDCPECQSHGTISVPISCTACGFESEWGFFPDET